MPRQPYGQKHSSMKTRNGKTRFVICISNKNYQACLELRKIYQALPDERAAKSKYVRIVEESEEDYLYPEQYFVPVNLPATVEKALLKAS